MLRALPLIVAIPLVIASGYVHGRLTGRWSRSDTLATSVAKLGRVPMAVGDWRGRALKLDPRVIEQAGIAGYLMRRYEDGKTGAGVTVLLVCGRPGPIAAHTPDVCYGGAGFEAQGTLARAVVRAGDSGPPAEFLTCVFRKTNPAAPAALRIHWSWNGGGAWEVSDHPRFRFARYQALYKLYVVRELEAAGSKAGAEDADLAFARAFLPELEKALF